MGFVGLDDTGTWREDRGSQKKGWRGRRERGPKGGKDEREREREARQRRADRQTRELSIRRKASPESRGEKRWRQ